MKKLNVAIIGQGRSGRDIHGVFFKGELNTKYNVVAIVDETFYGRLFCEQRNKFNVGDTVELLIPGKEPIEFTITEIKDSKGESVDTANHAQMKFSIPCPVKDIVVPKNSIIRMKK